VELPDGSGVLAPPSLALCTRLSQLVLNMKASYSCIVETPAAIFATLLEANSPSLSRITLEVEDAKSLFLAQSREECLDSWRNLDSILTMLSERLMATRGKKLVFIMEVLCEDDTVHRAKKWLPHFLPTFFEEGSLHVHKAEYDACGGTRDNVRDKRACMGKAVLKEYEYASESDEKIEEVSTAASGEGDGQNQEGGDAKGSKEGEKDEESDEGNKGDDEGEEENQENE
jgi:hypothetical protein